MAENQRDAIEQLGAGQRPWRAIEFFAGIGGFACAAPPCEIAAAIDIDRDARTVYQRHWSHPYWIREIGSLTAACLAPLDANLWWLSPPCQPYSRRGRQADVDDRRAASLLHLISLIPELRPRAIALENVSGFARSRARAQLGKMLEACGYHVMARELCPTELGWPNRRPRYYLLASLEPLTDWRPLPCYDVTLEQILAAAEPDFEERETCQISRDEQMRFGAAMDRVELAQPQAVTACFGSSYGKSLLHAGSYVVTSSAWRRFTPREVAALLGFPSWFAMPQHFSHRQAWRLLGNSLSIPAVRYVLSHLSPSTTAAY